MSRIGKLPIPIAKNVQVDIDGSTVKVKGPKGELVREFPAGISFAHEGEAYFRTVERQVLHELLPERSVVVAAGGGTFVEPDNRAVMLADGAVAWLDIPLSCVIDRIPRDGRRPLAADLTQLEQLYLRRRAAYADAHVRIDASRPAAEVVERLLEWIGY